MVATSRSVLFLVSAAVLHLACANVVPLHERDPATCTFPAVTPYPRGYFCEAHGSVSKGSVLTGPTVTDFDTCKASCLNNQPRCVSFSYGPGTQCITYNKKINMSKFKPNAASDQVFYNRHCFSKTCTCPVQTEQYCALTGACQDLQSDESNCGKCGNKCSGNTDTCCSGTCADITGTDPQNCGSCGNRCSSGDFCTLGRCVDCLMDSNCSQFTFGSICCNNTCHYGQSDDMNCGTCGNACGEGLHCSQGDCVQCRGQGFGSPDCSNGYACCGNMCYDTSSNNDNCGQCNMPCTGGLTCMGGNCVCPSSGVAPCSDGSCDLTTAAHCGSCNNACSNGQVCSSSGQCVDCVNDTDCSGGQTCCGGNVCRDLNNDENNCGGCGRDCNGGGCEDGFCQPL